MAGTVRRRDDFDFFNPGLHDWKTTQVEGAAGDVIIWSTRLPHGTSTRWWLTKRAPEYGQELPGQADPEPGPPAALSDLGLKLIGALRW